MSALPIQRLEVRCPQCRRLQFVVYPPANGNASVKCGKCNYVFDVDLSALEPCQHKVRVILSEIRGPSRPK